VNPAALAAAWEIPISEAAIAEVQAAYAQPPRHYHTWKHVRAVCRTIAEAGPWADPASVLVAALLHDAVYVVGRSDNEARSADLAVDWLRRHDVPADADRVAGLIRLTASHGGVSSSSVDAEAARFLDCDMAVLAAPPEVYTEYAAGVRAEWEPLVGDAYAQGRADFLARLLTTDAIFLSHWGAALEPAARANIAGEITALRR
jgi:predicted metal-dependent HD superfamily phosphohydrolase